MKQEILDYILAKDNVSFVELEQDIPGFKGDGSMVFGEYGNIVLWPYVSHEGTEAISELRDEGLIEMKPSTFNTYLMDGKTLELPVLTGKPRSKTKMYWLPVTFTKGAANATN